MQRGIDNAQRVSIHAFRGEGDLVQRQTVGYFAPFQSTPSGGKATLSRQETYTSRHRFNPRLPGGRRHGALVGV